MKKARVANARKDTCSREVFRDEVGSFPAIGNNLHCTLTTTIIVTIQIMRRLYAIQLLLVAFYRQNGEVFIMKNNRLGAYAN